VHKTLTPKVSVAIITYNHEKFIAQAIESVLAQEINFDYEIIVGDDCSNDSTPSILLSLQQQHPGQIQLFLNQTNLGMHKNFVQIFTACRGQYIALLEGDDYWVSSQKLQKQINFLDEHSDYALCFHDALIVFEDQQHPETKFCPSDLLETPDIERLFQVNYIPTASVIYRAGLVQQLPDWVFELKMLDWPLHLLHAQCGQMKYIDEIMSVYRIHKDSVWSSQKPVWQAKEIIKMMQAVSQNSSPKYKDTIDISINYFHEMLLVAYEQERQNLPTLTAELFTTPLMSQDLEKAEFIPDERNSSAPDWGGSVLYGSPADPIPFAEDDYVSPGFAQVKPDYCFPNMIPGDVNSASWPYLRREIPHNWYVDRRSAQVGFLNRDEAHILYNTALKFKGQAALEIGCWLGWSACHLALAGVILDVIDPVLEKSEFNESIVYSLRRAGVLDQVHLISGYSPEQVYRLVDQTQRKWPLIFIDGNHDAPGPLEDAQVCEQFAAEDALILFHDLTSPDVAQGLTYLKQQGWQTKIYQTMQIMGVAWRGNVEPVDHQPDPRVFWQIPTHLRDFLVDSPLHIDPQLSRYQEELDRLRDMVRAEQIELKNLWKATAQSSEQVQKTQIALEQSQALSEERHLWIEQLQSGKDWLENQVKLTQAALEQSQALSEECYRQIEQLRAENNRLEEQIESMQASLEHSRTAFEKSQTANSVQMAANARQAEQVQRLKLQKQKLQMRLKQKDFELRESWEKIEAMESSKFWKLRKGWFKLKETLGGYRYWLKHNS
jgi:glycosyltransferase involved in cell wall biosynthesis/predicted O-methyltransferase YrrM